MVKAKKKAAQTRKTATYTLNQHFENLDASILELFNAIRDHIISLDSSIEEGSTVILMDKGISHHEKKVLHF